MSLEDGGQASSSPVSLVRGRSFTGIFTSASPPPTAPPKHVPGWQMWSSLLVMCALAACAVRGLHSELQTHHSELNAYRAEVQAYRDAHSAMQQRAAATTSADGETLKHILGELAELKAKVASDGSLTRTEASLSAKATQSAVKEATDGILSKLEHTAATSHETATEMTAKLEQVARSAQEAIAQLETKFMQTRPPPADSLAAASAATNVPAVRLAPVRRLQSPPAAPVNPVPPPPPAPTKVVEVQFLFDAAGLTSASASLYWLRRNQSEHHYAEIAAGGRAWERTHAGECWRVRDSSTGNMLLSRWCATSEPRQLCRITAQEAVVLEFSFPKQPLLSSESITIVETTPVGGPALGRLASARELKVGTLSRGGFLTAPTRAGATFHVVDGRTNRLLQSVTATSEQLQYVTVGAGSVSLEFVAERNASKALSIFRVRADGDEHWVRSLAAGEAARVSALAGEAWVVREQLRDALVARVTATAEKSQRIYVAEAALTKSPSDT